MGSKHDPAEDRGEAVLRRLHRLAERLGAAGNYVEALRLQLRGAQTEHAALSAEKAAGQVRGAIEEFRGLRDLLAGTSQPPQPPPENRGLQTPATRRRPTE